MLTLIEDLGIVQTSATSKEKRRYGIYKCECGNTKKIRSTDVNIGKTKSCGCISINKAKELNKKHGLSSHPLYHIWFDIVDRCHNENSANYKYYGARGITMCEEWHDINKFISDMHPSFKKGLTIDRRNNNSNYSKDNCRWVSRSVQSQNTRLLCKSNTSGYRGVYLHKASMKWNASICVNNVRIHLGSYIEPDDAAIAYNNYVIRNNTNHPLNIIKEYKC
jgi:hypothetical protein